MRKFTDIFIERPVLATVVSLTIFVLGLRSIGLLPVLQYPRTQNAVVTETNTKVNAVLNQLPPGAQQPVLTVKVGQTIAAMYIGFASDALAPNKITDYLIRVVQPKLQAVEGVQSADILGGKLFAMRAWLDP